jgi:hypothetical protein
MIGHHPDRSRITPNEPRLARGPVQLSVVLIADQGVMAWTTPRADQDDRHGR